MQIAGSTGEYLRFLLPGTLVMTVLLLTMYTGVGLSTDSRRGTFDRFRSMPIWRPAPIVGALIGDVGRYLVAGALVLGLGLAMGFRPEAGPRAVPAALGLILVFASGSRGYGRRSACSFGPRTPSPTSAWSSCSRSRSRATSSSTPTTTPGWLQAVIHVNPVTHLVTAVAG